MQNINIQIQTITPVSNINSKEKSYIVYFDNHIYFVDIKKLEFVLTLLKKLSNFIKFLENSNTKNITDFLLQNNLLYEEILNEISLEKINIIELDNHKLKQENFIYNNIEFSENSLIELIKDNIRNIMLFEYLSENFENFNNYTTMVLLSFLNKHQKHNEINLKSFIRNLLEIDSQKIKKYDLFVQNIKITIQENADIYDITSFEKLSNQKSVFYKTCLEENKIIAINIKFADKLKNNFQKYLQIAKSINKRRLDLELSLLLNSNENDNFRKIKIESDFLKSNFSFISLEQVFYFNLNENNKRLLSSLFFQNSYLNMMKYFYCFIANSNCKSKFVNYAKIEYEIV